MRYYIATVLYAAIFATMYISSEALGSDVHCFSCFGYDRDGNTKCHSREEGWLTFVIECPASSTADERPVCIKFTASYTVNQLVGDTLVDVPSKAHGLYCGTRQKNTTQCNKGHCPNHWFPNNYVTNCDVSCCDDSDKDCKFPLPTQDDIDRHKWDYPGKLAQPQVKLGDQAVAGKRSGMGARISWCVWLQAVSFVLLDGLSCEARDF
ncbi:hypothetical protein OS493_003579 [Desmophyllum pertusum]|uniref:Sodefrin-like factor n=1 Tax=Desmophyllum pertusum TaxID=174260 RepID=A0A9X0A628_9CNID|nr:hypothetical protein OS493_003579 [Desmophyllum pertusum]